MLDKVPLLSVDYLRVVYASMLFIDKCLRRNRVDNPQVTPPGVAGTRPPAPSLRDAVSEALLRT
jgi:hypothetical protein